MAPLNKKEVRNRMEEIMIESNHSTKPVYIPKRGKKKKNYCKSDDKHQEKQKEKHEDVKKRTSKS